MGFDADKFREELEQKIKEEQKAEDEAFMQLIGKYVAVYRRIVLKDNPVLMCPSCKSKCFVKFSYTPLVFYSTECKICNTPVGFTKGEVKARKLGSYLRLIDDNKQISIDISSFGNNFDVRKGDNVTIIYQLNVSKKRPVMLINHTINELYYEFAHERENPKNFVDLTKVHDGKFFKEFEERLPAIELINLDLKTDVIWDNKTSQK